MNSSLTVICVEVGLPSTMEGEYFHCLTVFSAASRSNIGPLIAFASTTFPLASIIAETTTAPWTCDCFASEG